MPTVRRVRSQFYAKKFSGKYAHRTIKGGVGHNLPCRKFRRPLRKLSWTLIVIDRRFAVFLPTIWHMLRLRQPFLLSM